MLCDKKGSSSNRGVIECFNMERDTFTVEFSKTWDTMLKLLDVLSLASMFRHMCQDGHRVWRFLPEDMYEMHKEDKYEVCNKARFHTLKGKLKPVRVIFYKGLKYVLAFYSGSEVGRSVEEISGHENQRWSPARACPING